MPAVEELQQQIADKDREIADLRQRLQDEVGTLYDLIQVTVMLTSTLNLRELLQQIMTAAADLLKAETVVGLLVDEETGELKYEGVIGQGAKVLHERHAAPGRGVAETVLQNPRPLVIEDPASDERYADQSDGFVVRNVLVVPLRVKDRVIGVAEIINKRNGQGFSEQDVELAEALASQASVAIDNARLYSRLSDAVVAARLPYRP